MPRLLQSLWLLLASVTDWQLARIVEFPNEENRSRCRTCYDRLTGTPNLDRSSPKRTGQHLSTPIIGTPDNRVPIRLDPTPGKPGRSPWTG
jgi:hypothetical protein